ncbi:MBL fold metallo-hydrolase [Sinorhizobium sp. NFACC03]|uniref:MBL fold metallo-hydrolase n=1 Tax=Sinorhizobium sp. NFACC03 TaxID=1566295 RepID=UPI0008886A29|nr:MBL fold metallo-hydrolase [Sinorhizobium sp. NFACC03]SDA59424.1 hypothetical protein SAMN03159448_01612 [Sinorhizobium sp. NFACC03]
MRYLDDDVVNLRRADGSQGQYYWGDRCNVLSTEGSRMRVEILGARGKIDEGFIRAETRLRDTGLPRLSMVDVQQGDGLILETPEGKVIFIDGGDNQLFARHANARFPNTSDTDPLVVDLILITHGDADHFEGLVELRKSEDRQPPEQADFHRAEAGLSQRHRQTAERRQQSETAQGY